MPTVSVVIATYNRARLLRAAIQSVLGQTFQDYEVVVVDDGSTDATQEVVAGLSTKVTCVRQENRGRSNARNRGIALSRGKYIAFLDSDDMWLPQKLEVQVAAMEKHPEFAMSYTAAQVVDEVHHIVLMLRVHQALLKAGYSVQILERGPISASRCFIVGFPDQAAGEEI